MRDDPRDVRVYPDLEHLSRAAAEELVDLAEAAVAERDRFTLALSGGQTPRLLYELLATTHRAAMPWRRCHIFWGDERYVSPEDPRSNYHMAQDNLLDHVPVPGDNIHPMPTLLPEIEEAAEAYEQTVMDYFSGDWPRFDLVLLGMGANGHIASLFPHNPVLTEQARVVAAVRDQHAEPPLRLTLTLPAINHAANIWFLVAGKGKANALKTVFSEKPNRDIAPATAVHPVDGTLVWWVDDAAMSEIDRSESSQ